MKDSWYLFFSKCVVNLYFLECIDSIKDYFEKKNPSKEYYIDSVPNTLSETMIHLVYQKRRFLWDKRVAYAQEVRTISPSPLLPTTETKYIYTEIQANMSQEDLEALVKSVKEKSLMWDKEK